MRHPPQLGRPRLTERATWQMTLLSGIKSELRKAYLAHRDNIPEKGRSHRSIRACERIVNMDEFHSADIILSYYPIGSEADSRSIMEAALTQGKKVALPVCIPKTRTLEWHIVDDLDDMVEGYANIPEPPRDPSTEVDPSSFAKDEAIAIVPGVAFDRNGYRIGYGGGYYDRFLSRFEGPTIGFAFEEQIADDLKGSGAIEDHDVAMDSLVIA